MSLDEIDLKTLPMHRYPVTIRERHLDTFGHVNHVQYLILFEEARWEMITSRGRGMKEVVKSHLGTVVLEYSARFKSELKYREKAIITTQVQSLSKKIMRLEHTLLKENGEVAAEALVAVGCFDLKNRKLITPDPNWVRAVTGLGVVAGS